MFKVSPDEFEKMVHDAVDNLPKVHRDGLKNVGIFTRDWPSNEQMQKGNLLPNHILLGLYEGVPLSKRNGNLKLLPDIITLFQLPLESRSNSLVELKEQIKHTLWHEVAHYYGLDHEKIYSIEDDRRNKSV